MKFDFKLQHHAETARAAQLTIGRQTLETPSLIMPAPALTVHDLAPAEVKRSRKILEPKQSVTWAACIVSWLGMVW